MTPAEKTLKLLQEKQASLVRQEEAARKNAAYESSRRKKVMKIVKKQLLTFQSLGLQLEQAKAGERLPQCCGGENYDWDFILSKRKHRIVGVRVYHASGTYDTSDECRDIPYEELALDARFFDGGHWNCYQKVTNDDPEEGFWDDFARYMSWTLERL